RSTRWERRPARGTWWRCGGRPGGSSRTRIRAGDRAGLPREPGRGFFQDVALFPERLVLAAEPAQLRPFLGGQPVLAPALIAVRLAEPIPDRLAGRLELPAQLLGRAPRSGQLDEPRPELRGIRRSGLWHRGLLPPPKGEQGPRNRVKSTQRAAHP